MAGGSSDFPNRPFRLRDSTTVTRQEFPNNRSLLHFEVWIDKLSYSPTWSNNGPAYTRWGYDGGVVAESNPGSFDFQGTGPWLWLSGDHWVGHNTNGTKAITVQVGGDFALLGATTYQYGFTLPTIPRDAPPAPTALTLDQISRTSMRFSFRSNGSGSTPITRYDVQVSESPSFSGGRTIQTSGSPLNITGLKSGTVYYVRVRAVNSIGASAYSNTISARTLSGAWISTGTAWVAAEVLISDGKTWRAADVQISDGKSWRPAG